MFKDKLLAFNEIDLDNLDSGRSKAAQKINKISDKDIAVIGVGVKMPKAATFKKFWVNIRDSMDCIGKIPPNRYEDIENYLYFIGKGMDNVSFEDAAYLDEIDKFDCDFFKISPKEASLMDPNQRLFLETAWNTLEDAGYGGGKLRGTRIGVYVGFGVDSEYKALISDVEPSSISMSVPGNLNPIIASRIAYLLDLKGPNMLVNTACSSSLVAIHLACQAISVGECDLAVAGGVQTYALPIRQAILGIESSNNRAKAFDDSSDGTGGGEGVGAVLLKPLSKALKDRDNIYAVIKGSAVNQDGSSIGITAPNPAAQEDVIVRAWKDAEIEPETVTYIEAHGTGTKLGDPIEIEGITGAFNRYTGKKQFCAVGSVKTNIGHLDNSAGVAGFLKAVAALKYRMLPPNLHFSRPNRKINFEESAVYVSEELCDWEVEGMPRRCGVSSFGLSGTNCHVVLEEFTDAEKEKTELSNSPMVLTISVKSEESLKELIATYVEFLKEDTLDIRDVCFTANCGRGHYNYRIAVVFDSLEDLKEKITSLYINWYDRIAGKDIYSGGFRVVTGDEVNMPGEITELEKRNMSETALLKLKEYLKGGQEAGKLLEEVCTLYIKGADIDWELLYRDGERKRVSIPVYPFKRDRCWLELLKRSEGTAFMNKCFHYVISWDIKELENETNKLGNGAAIVFMDSMGKAARACEALRQQGIAVIEVVLGTRYEMAAQDKFIIVNCEEDYIRLIKEIDSEQLRYIIHAGALQSQAENLEQLESSQEKGVHSLFYLSRAVVKCIPQQKLTILIVADFVNEVTGSEAVLYPHGATLFGLGRTLNWEYPYMNFKCIDIDDKTDLYSLDKELKVTNREYIASYRDGKRYVEVLDEVDIASLNDEEISIRENGVYVITGGLGRIGCEMGKYIASKAKVNLVVVNRSGLPPREEWDNIVKDGKEKSLKIKEMRQIEEKGSIVDIYCADITVQSEIKEVLDKVRKKYGRINGLIHSAGIGVGMQGCTLGNDSCEVFQAVMKPKVEATWLLDSLTCGDDLDFFVLFSSAITMIGGVGSGSYTAANSYLDSFSAYRNKKEKKTITINWPAWDKDGLVEMAKINEDKQLLKIISPDNAVSAFHMALNKPLNRVIIGELNYSGKVFELEDYLPFKMSQKVTDMVKESKRKKQAELAKASGYARKSVKLKGKQEYSNMEKKIAAVWQEVLGFQELNVHDNFFEIGGDSILITKVFKNIYSIFPEKVKIVDLFTYPTISKLAQYVMSLNEDNSLADSMEAGRELLRKKITGLVEELESGRLSLEETVKAYNLIGEET